MRAELDPSYSFAPGIFSRERTYHLGREALRWENPKGQDGSLAYADVDTMHIFYLYQAYGFGTQVCVIRARLGAKCVLKSKNFRTWGRSDDRAGAYVPFVRDLLSRVAAGAPQARFFDGLPTGWYLSQLIALAVCAVIIATALAPMLAIWRSGSVSDSGSAISTLLITLGVLILPMIGVCRTLARGRVHPVDPRRLPDELAGLRLAPQP
jgi:hypothetical protein